MLDLKLQRPPPGSLMSRAAPSQVHPAGRTHPLQTSTHHHTLGRDVSFCQPIVSPLETVQHISRRMVQELSGVVHVVNQAPQWEQTKPGPEEVLIHMEQMFLFFHKQKQLISEKRKWEQREGLW